MTYANIQDMLDRFGEQELLALSDRDDVGVVCDEVVDEALVSATGEIDPYLMGMYTLPLNPVPVIVRDFTCDIARFRLCGAGVTVTEEIRKRYEDAIKFFTKVSKGEIKLGLSEDGQAAASTGSVKTSAPGKVFNADAMTGFR